MVVLKTAKEMRAMREAGKIAGQALAMAGRLVQPGIETREIDRQVRSFIEGCGAVPSFLGYGGFPNSLCISVNDVVIHGIPSKRKLAQGDIVSIDVGAFYGGYHGDTAATFAAGEASKQAQNLMDVTRQALHRAIAVARPGMRIGDLSSAVQTFVEEKGYSVVRQFVGHGVGEKLHEDPEVPNFGRAGHGLRLVRGMTLAIEPMVTAGGFGVRILPDQWTTVTADGSLAAHFEHTIGITEEGAVLLTEV